MHVTIEAAKATLADLVEAVLKGDNVVIIRDDNPIARLVPITPVDVGRRPFRYGVLAGKLEGLVPDFLEPMSNEDLVLWEGDSADGR